MNICKRSVILNYLLRTTKTPHKNKNFKHGFYEPVMVLENLVILNNCDAVLDKWKMNRLFEIVNFIFMSRIMLTVMCFKNDVKYTY